MQAEYAGFWVRLAAYAIDSVIVFFGLLVVRLFLAGVLSVLSGTWLGGNILFHYTLKDILLYVFQVLYFILCTWLTGTTLGKRAMNLRVISACPEEPLGLLDVVYRETIGRFLCSLSVGIGYIMAGVDKEKRGLHDFLCDTRVIYAKKIKVIPVYPRYQAPLVRPAGPGHREIRRSRLLEGRRIWRRPGTDKKQIERIRNEHLCSQTGYTGSCQLGEDAGRHTDCCYQL